jgi:3-hydroxyisobutyrate dehydrogenase-like beta-hydroxyacid dehydrogenase
MENPVGFAGLGVVGLPMAVNLADAALPVTSAVAALYDEVAAQGPGHLDNSAVLAALRRLPDGGRDR